MILITSLVGMLEYMLLISREANFKLWSYGMSVRSFISWTVFVTLYVNGRGVYEVSFFAIILASLYPGAFSQFMIGLMGVSSLCNFTRPLKVGAVGFKFTYFHFSLLCITLWHSFTVLLTSLCKCFVMSVCATVKLLLEIKSSTKFAQHLIDNKHAIGRMEDIMEIVHITQKGKMMDTLESFHIYKETKAGNQINDRMTVKENTIFETVIHQDPYRRHAAPQPPNS